MSTSVLTPVAMRLPFTASSVGVARQRLKGSLADAGRSAEGVDDARVVISELVANSVRHARPLPDGSVLVAWALGKQGLQLSVTDGGSGTRPRTVDASSSALAGRGMAIVDVLTREWWVEAGESRSTVHALLPL